MAHNDITLYVWPALWDLPSFDPYCLSAILYLQLAIPGKFSIVKCSDPDLSPSGQLPFLVHGQQVVATFISIVKYVTNLATTEKEKYGSASNVDGFLSPLQRSQRNAWYAHVESNLGDLLSCELYSSHENWEKLVHPAIASLFPVPQRYFVPQKLREAYIPRLEVAGLWSHIAPSLDVKKPFEKEDKLKSKADKSKFQKAFEKEKVVTKARLVLDIYKRLVGDGQYIYENQISSIDVAIASRVLLLLNPLYPDPSIKSVLEGSYPELVSHSRRVYDRVMGSDAPSLNVRSHQPSLSLWSFIPLWKSKNPLGKALEKSEEDKHIERMRWAFLGLSLGSLVAYLAVVGARRVKIVVNQVPEGEDEDQVSEDDDEEEEELLAELQAVVDEDEE